MTTQKDPMLTLFITPRSPFARRVRLALLENQVPFQEEACDIFKPSGDLLKLNPLGRVPFLRLPSGSILIDSNLIIQWIYENFESALVPKEPSEVLNLYYWQALAVGLCEKTVEFYLDTLRPASVQDQECRLELERGLSLILPLLEQHIKERTWIVGTQVTQADLDMGSALGYVNLRYGSAWREKFPNVSRYFAHLEQRPSFSRTTPPPA